MQAPLTFRDKYGFPYQKDAGAVLFAKAMGQKCLLHFEDGTELVWSYPLEEFHKKVYALNLFRRVHRQYVLKVSRALSKKYLLAPYALSFCLVPAPAEIN